MGSEITAIMDRVFAVLDFASVTVLLVAGSV